MLHYIVQTIAFQLLFLIIYDLFLKKETFFNWNRLYLLLTPVLSLIIPLVKIPQLSKVVPQNYVVRLPEVFIGDASAPQITTTQLEPVVIQTQSVSLWETVFYLGMLVMVSIFMYKVFVLFRLIHKNPRFRKHNLVIVQLLRSTSAFSFFNYIFLGERIETSEKKAILKHEMVHVREKHSWDLLFFEVLKIVFWFNPLVYMFQKRIQALHEFIADAEALKQQGKQLYYQNLLSQVFETRRMSFINPFFKQSLIKKRIVMLQKSKSKQIKLLKYALLIPIVFGMLIYTSAEAQDKSINEIGKESTISDDELKKELREEYNKMKSSGANIFEGFKAFTPKSKNYILSKEEYYRRTIFFEDLAREFLKNNKNGEKYKPKTYAEYLEWKTTDEAKEEWENKTHDGVLKLVVDDLGDLTPEEQKKYDKKMELLLNDDFFKSFILMSNNVIVKVEPEPVNAPKEAENDFEHSVEVPFAVIDQAPIFPGCENISKEEQKKCISKNIAEHVSRNFNTKLANKLGLVGRQRINVIFKINKQGNIIGIRSRAPHPDLESEAIRVINTLPKMIPGKHNGKNVVVPYSLPIVFQVHDQSDVDGTETTSKVGNNDKHISEEAIEVPFAVIENVPIYPGCEDLSSNDERKRCMSEKLRDFVIENFNTKKASEYGLSGRQKVNVIFKIDTKGNVIRVRSRGPHPVLEAEAIRVISSLPKMQPGMQKGKAVTVPYSLPIVFEIDGKTTNEHQIDTSKNLLQQELTEVPFAVVDQVPLFPGCESVIGNEAQKQCTSDEISKYVQVNFNTGLGKKLGLKGTQRINVIFHIDTIGNIAKLKIRAPHPKLEEEAKRIITSLPKMIPGEHEGEKVSVPYSLPIIFQVP